MTAKESREKQLRYTLQDCLYYQDNLRGLLQNLIRENRPLTHPEKQKYFEMLPKALLSQGSVEPVSVVIQSGWFTFSSIQNLALRMADLYSDKVSLKTSRPEIIEITILIGELWQFLYDKILYLYPQACAEAIHISAESIERAQQGAYEFTHEEVLHDRA
jgi:hypothetical protein